jgi:adenylylsulfate kinase
MKTGIVAWFTGLSGSGKSTVSAALKRELEKWNISVFELDGDEVRKRLHTHLTLSPEDIKKNNFLVAEICKEKRGEFDVVLVSVIGPYEEIRKKIATDLSPKMFFIYCNADLESVMTRDVKGLYLRAKSGEISNMIGYSKTNVYQPPVCPDLVLNTGLGGEKIVHSVEKVLEFILNKMGDGSKNNLNG